MTTTHNQNSNGNPPRQPRRRGTRSTTLEVALKIIELRRTTDLTQHGIAAVLGINQGIVSMVLSGKIYPELTIN